MGFRARLYITAHSERNLEFSSSRRKTAALLSASFYSGVKHGFVSRFTFICAALTLNACACVDACFFYRIGLSLGGGNQST